MWLRESTVTVLYHFLWQNGGECVRAYVSCSLDQVCQWQDGQGNFAASDGTFSFVSMTQVKKSNSANDQIPLTISKGRYQQECIPVGCVPSAAVAASAGGGGVCQIWSPSSREQNDRCKNIILPQLSCGR